ncbi:MAG: histidine kinase, partial [Ferruginibacter sp.]
MQYADSLVLLAKRLPLPFFLARSYITKATGLQIQGLTSEALQADRDAINLLKNLKTREALLYKATAYQSMATVFTEISEYDSSVNMSKQSLSNAYEAKDTFKILAANNSLAVVYMAVADWETALTYEKNIKSLLEQDGGRLLKMKKYLMGLYIGSLINIGIIESVRKHYDIALASVNKGLQLARETKDIQGEMASASLLAEIYYRLKDYTNSYVYSMISYKRNAKSNNRLYLCMDYKNLGRIFRDASDSSLLKWNINPEKRYDTVLSLFKASIKIADEYNSLTLKEDPAEDVAIAYEKMGNYGKAYEYFKEFKSIHDSLGSASQQKRILLNDMQYQFGRQTDSLKFSEALIQSHLKEELSVNAQNAIIANKENELQHLAFLQAQTQLENKSLENNRNEKELSLTKKEKELQAAQVGKLGKDKELADLELKQQRIYSIIAIAFLLVITSLLLYNNYQRRKRMAAGIAKDKAEQQLKEAELKNRMNDITLSALRSQMNPHFIFNCLNSIKLYTKENNTIEASDYIGKFAKLIRNMLDNSRSDRISLESEIESLKLYIELEAMRFKDKLHYAINVDKDLDISFIDIPPLLVQPYIENAIWHGLMPKKEGGH